MTQPSKDALQQSPLSTIVLSYRLVYRNAVIKLHVGIVVTHVEPFLNGIDDCPPSGNSFAEAVRSPDILGPAAMTDLTDAAFLPLNLAGCSVIPIPGR